MRFPSVLAGLAGLILIGMATGCRHVVAARAWQPLFPKDGPPAGWVVRAWNDVAQPAPTNAQWQVVGGELHSVGARGCWLMSEREFGDFDLEFEFKLGPRGNSGLALRAPLAGDPAFDGMELQMADVRYNPEAKPSELTGGLYRALAPRRQVYRPEEWNHYEVSLRGDHVRVRLNGVTIQDVDLARQTTVVQRHDGTDAPPLVKRPRRGHLGFQELSRESGHVVVRNAFIRTRD